MHRVIWASPIQLYPLGRQCEGKLPVEWTDKISDFRRVFLPLPSLPNISRGARKIPDRHIRPGCNADCWRIHPIVSGRWGRLPKCFLPLLPKRTENCRRSWACARSLRWCNGSPANCESPSHTWRESLCASRDHPRRQKEPRSQVGWRRCSRRRKNCCPPSGFPFHLKRPHLTDLSFRRLYLNTVLSQFRTQIVGIVVVNDLHAQPPGYFQVQGPVVYKDAFFWGPL